VHRYNHSQEQQAHLIRDLQETGQRLLGFAFESPETDGQNIRHHAYLRGKFDQLKLMLDDNYPNPEIQPTEDD